MSRGQIGGIILVGGQGTRLRPLTLHQPKALLPVLNRPFLAYQFAALKNAGVDTVCLAANPWFRRWRRSITALAPRGLKIIWAFEKKPLGTGGAIRYGFDHLSRRLPGLETVVVFNGDVLIEADIKSILRFHANAASDCTIALTRVKDSSRFGLVNASSTGRIRSFLEKPRGPARPGWINAGLYVASSRFLGSIPANRPLSVEREVFPARVKEGWGLFARRIQGYWNDIGTPATYLSAHHDLMQRRGRWTGIGNLSKGLSLLRGARLLRGSGCVIAKSATLIGSVSLGRKVVIGPQSHVRDSVLMDGCVIEGHSSLNRVVLGRRCKIGEGSVLSEGTVLGEGTVLPPNAVIPAKAGIQV